MRVILVVILSLISSCWMFAQSPNGSIRGIVFDPDAKSIAGAEVIVVNDATGVKYVTSTNADGLYAVENLPPGPYRIQVSKFGFKGIIKPDIILNVQDVATLNFTLPIGASSVTVTVEGGAPMINTTDASVSTVVDRQFAENLPLNGRSFQTLIQLTPGVVLTPGGGADSGQFSVNGQRASANYWMVDGVSANVGSSTLFGGNGASGATGTASVFGGTNSLVSVDALQEFRIQTSTYAPEFGRTPGGQISIVTRSGTSQFHGSAFDYLRNDKFDANNWFNGVNILNATPLRKAEERQNDFGGTFSGAILKDKTFFFFSYEGLRLRLPQTTLTTVPDLQERRNASSAEQPFLNAFPFDPKQPDLGNGIAQFNSSYSNPAKLDAYSLRVDHKLRESISLFGRYNYSPSEIDQRGGGAFGAALSVISPSRITAQTATVGLTLVISPAITNDLRFNYSRTNASSRFVLDNFGGAVPLMSFPFPSPYTEADANFVYLLAFLSNGTLQGGAQVGNLQRQVNLVEGISIQKGRHSLKFGIDFRRLSPQYAPFLYGQTVFILDAASAQNRNVFASSTQAAAGGTLLLHNLGVYAQDSWRLAPRLTATYGLRWDVDFAPSSASGPGIRGVTGFDFSDLSQLALASPGVPPFKTSYRNFAPRVGLAYQLSQSQAWGTVARGGFGVFYDLATSELGNVVLQSGYPFAAAGPFLLGGTFPLGSSAAAPPVIVPPSPANPGKIAAFDPNLKLPYALEWNVALEQGLGSQQTFSASYIGSVGRRLIQSAAISSPNPAVNLAVLVTNGATSDYSALQLQFQRRLSRNFQTLASYTWSHSIDDASAGSLGVGGNKLVPTVNALLNRGPSDFDIRNAFSVGLTYNIPTVHGNAFGAAVLGNWSLENILQARSAPPINIYNSLWGQSLQNASTLIRPDVKSGVPLYLHGSPYPGAKAINPAAFTAPAKDSQGNFLQGDLGRNALRGFGATQWDFGVHREFPIRETLKLQFRAEMFNVLNHPNFGQPTPDLRSPTFGLSTQMLAGYLSGGQLGSGGFSSLYEIGGPRSIQFALKVMF